MATERGIVKKTALSAYSRPQRGGIIAINLDDDDELISVRLTDGAQQVALSTRSGMLVRFEESEARPMGRNAGGVKGVQSNPVGHDVIRVPINTLFVIGHDNVGADSAYDLRQPTRGFFEVCTSKGLGMKILRASGDS